MIRHLYTSPVDHHTLENWPELAAAMRRDVEASCGRDVVVEIGDGPVFGYGVDSEETLLGLEEQTLAQRHVRLDLWSSIALYGAVSVLLGSGVKRKERRALERRLGKKSLKGQTLLRTHEGTWDEESGRVYGYRLSPGDAGDRAVLEHLLFAFERPLYLGESWLLKDEKESYDEAAFEAIEEVGRGLAFFLPRDGDSEENVWQMAPSGDGLVALYPDDEARDALVRHFHDMRDLPLLAAEIPSAGMRVTIGRCHQDDSLVVVYGPPHAPEIETPILFMI